MLLHSENDTTWIKEEEEGAKVTLTRLVLILDISAKQYHTKRQHEVFYRHFQSFTVSIIKIVISACFSSLLTFYPVVSPYNDNVLVIVFSITIPCSLWYLFTLCAQTKLSRLVSFWVSKYTEDIWKTQLGEITTSKKPSITKD